MNLDRVVTARKTNNHYEINGDHSIAAISAIAVIAAITADAEALFFQALQGAVAWRQIACQYPRKRNPRSF